MDEINRYIIPRMGNSRCLCRDGERKKEARLIPRQICLDKLLVRKITHLIVGLNNL